MPHDDVDLAAPMAGRSTWAACQLAGGATSPALECLAEEVPVAMVYNGISHAVMLASPLDLEDFALGFSLSEGIVDAPEDVLDVEVQIRPLAGSLVSGEPAAGAVEPGLALEMRVAQRCFARLKEHRRSLAGRTGCGLCGTERLAEAVRPVPGRVAPVQVPAAALSQAMSAMWAQQALQHATGATHAAAWCDLGGHLHLVREDVGRHNALDKLVGAMARARVDPASGFITVTSRASYEMVHKAACAGVGLLAAVSAPTGLAVRTAQAAGMTLAGFTRGDRSVLYTHAHQVRTG
jgi:FdhD protein